jgi:hypothetical protein
LADDILSTALSSLVKYLVTEVQRFHWLLLFNLLAYSSHPCCFTLRKDAKKVSKLEAQIPYHEGRGNKDEVEKIKAQVAAIWEKAKESAFAA